MAPVVLGSWTNTDLIKMKFLVLALCVCAASAASFGAYKPWQQAPTAFAQAVVSPVVAAREVVIPGVKAYKPVAKPYEPVVKPYEPIAKPVVKTYEPTVKAAVYADKDATAAVLRSESDVSADGFNYIYETANGIAAQSSGTLKRVDNSDVLAIQGSYQYTAPDGTPVQFSYIADENGYQPKSNLLPVGPPIPDDILRSLEYIRSQPKKYDEKY